MSDGVVQIGFASDAYWVYTLETSTNLSAWLALSKLTRADGLFNFNAGTITRAPQQLFRVRAGR